MEYRCEFKIEAYPFLGMGYTCYSDGGIADFKDGFWVNDKFEFTKSSDCKYWVPPGKISYIAKYGEVNDND